MMLMRERAWITKVPSLLLAIYFYQLAMGPWEELLTRKVASAPLLVSPPFLPLSPGRSCRHQGNAERQAEDAPG